nr:hypothetical protein [Tanacetum cinerariifolium]
MEKNRHGLKRPLDIILSNVLGSSILDAQRSGETGNLFFCHKVLGVLVLSFKCDKVLPKVSTSRFWFKEGFLVRVLLSSRILLASLLLGFQVSETGLLDFLAFRFVNDKVAAGGYQQVKVLEFFDYPGPRQGVEDLRELLHRVNNDDIKVAQTRLEDKQYEEKTNTDSLVKEQEKEYQTGWKIKTGNVLYSCNQSIKQAMLESVKVKCKFMGYHKIIVGNKLWRLNDVTSKVVLYRNIGFNESRKYKKTFIGSSVGTGSMQVLHGFEFEMEPLGDHTFEMEPQENVDQGAGL